MKHNHNMPGKKLIPSTDELKLLKKALQCIQRNKRLTPKTYTTLLESNSLPRKLKRSIEFYQNHIKTGGRSLSCSISGQMSFHIIGKQTIPVTINIGDCIGKGANGEVYMINENTVLKVIDLSSSPEVFDALCKVLPLVFDTLKDEAIYSDVMVSNEEHKRIIAYQMPNLIPVPIKNNGNITEKWFTFLLSSFGRAVSSMHKKGILHLDLKVDNIMMLPFTTNTGKNKLLDSIRNVKIIDYDGSIMLSPNTTNEDVSNELAKGWDYHPTTPAFAHWYVLGKLSKIDDVRSIETVRRFSTANNMYILVDHFEVHASVFDVKKETLTTVDILFNPKSSEVQRLKYCDCYSLCMSLLIMTCYYITENNKTTEEEKTKLMNTCKLITINYLKNVAKALNLHGYVNSASISIGGTTPEVSSNSSEPLRYVNDNEYIVIGLGSKAQTYTVEEAPTDNSYPEITDDDILEESILVTKYE